MIHFLRATLELEASARRRCSTVLDTVWEVRDLGFLGEAEEMIHVDLCREFRVYILREQLYFTDADSFILIFFCFDAL